MASPTSPHSSQLPTRTLTNTTDTDAIPDEDSSELTKLFHERLQAWKHACGYLEDYITATDKMQHAHGKEYEKVLKTVNSPLKEGHHFTSELGGIASMFDNIRTNTQGISNSHEQTAKTLKGTVLPIFERLHSEIKSKQKELSKGVGKQSKAVDKARATSQKHIELLGSHTSTFDAAGGNVKAADDPYIVQRQIYHRLNKQILEENNSRDDLLSVQNNFSQFEAHVVATVQSGMTSFIQVVQQQQDQTRNMYGDILANAQKIPQNFEWQGFVKRNNNVLIDPSAPKRSIENISFPNQNHRATQPLIAGSLERKGKMLKSYNSSFYVVTPSKYLHEFKTDDDFAKDPEPENSLYLPDCLVGAVDGVKFNVSGKDSSKGALGSKFSMKHEFAFRAHTPADAQKWHQVIASCAGQTSNELPYSEPNSPADNRKFSNLGSEGGSTVASPTSPAGAQETGTTGAIHGDATGPRA
ncbi:PH domain protein [Polychaeton citri CBS 116435]|uniref:PH domain protein n=1 Tax=Polychaeton citri CBS 116435 TaxID=1314669 RepID=A0A9P4PXM6_9PEZI|nr:PH domain protein [Polychaeton citri CBS 116435]